MNRGIAANNAGLHAHGRDPRNRHWKVQVKKFLCSLITIMMVMGAEKNDYKYSKDSKIKCSVPISHWQMIFNLIFLHHL